MAEPNVQYHDAIASNTTRSVTFSGRGCNGTVSVRQGTMMNAAPVPLGDGARMSFLYRDPKNYADPNGNSVVDRKSVVEGKSVSVRVDLGGRRIMKKKKQTNNNKDKSKTKTYKKQN